MRKETEAERVARNAAADAWNENLPPANSLLDQILAAADGRCEAQLPGCTVTAVRIGSTRSATGSGRSDLKALCTECLEAVKTDSESRAKVNEKWGTTTPLRSVKDDATGLPVGADGLRLTDKGNAERLVALHGKGLRYVPAWGMWLVWDGTRFGLDPADVQVRQKAMDISRKLWEANGAWAKRSESKTSISNAVDLARSIPGIAINHEGLDDDPWLLNIENGVVDLRAGKLLDHDPGRLITKRAPVRWQPKAVAPIWTAFLEKVLPDPEVRDFVQKAVGYSLTGDVSEQVLIIATGGGSNGKSVFVTTMRNLMGDYGVTAPKDLLVTSHHEPHPTSMTVLHGARFAAAVETEAGSKLNEVQVKQLTGGDRMSGRRMRENFWEFDPSHKLWLSTNHRPRIHGLDHAIWRRIRLIPFDVTIADEDQDKDLTGKLIAELPGILQWAVEGCRRWQAEGLAAPSAVAAATAEYRVEEDWMARFCEDSNVEIGNGGSVARSELSARYARWCSTEGIHPESGQVLAAELRKRGAQDGKSAGLRYWRNVSVENVVDV